MNKIAKWIYEATRIEAEWNKRKIVPEKWEDRSPAFREQFIKIIETYFKNQLPTPNKAHDSWVKAYEVMGWKYGKIRNIEKKTHPDMVSFEDLSKDEQEKDAIFLSFVFLAKKLKKIFDITLKQAKEIILSHGTGYSQGYNAGFDTKLTNTYKEFVRKLDTIVNNIKKIKKKYEEKLK